MFYRTFLLILCLALIPLYSNEDCSIEPTPSWVKTYDFPLDPVPIKPTQVNLQYLLIETQRNWEEKTYYYHDVIRMLTKNGIETISKLSINFDPAFSHVVMHQIQVLRDGEWFDRLANARRKIVQRETDLEENLFSGDLTAIYFIEDIREGDVLEYSYSIVGEDPIFDSHLIELIYLQEKFEVEKKSYRLLAPPDLYFERKAINTIIEPKITDLSPSLREWEWIAVEPPFHKYEEYQPIWDNPPPCIELSQYKTWAEVAQKVAPFFHLPADFSESIPEEMTALVECWKAATLVSTERALLALRFVQDEVRYLGFEENVGRIIPTDPRITFQRRFGDCKDKTQLLRALLSLMDIDSTPILVHSSDGISVAKGLPMPKFDHVILQLDIDGTTYWVDSTANLLGGSFETSSLPNFHWGLILADTTTELTPLPQRTLPHPTKIDSAITFESKETALMRSSITFYSFVADCWRRMLEEKGYKKISEGLLHNFQKIYGRVTIVAPLEVFDDRENNLFTLSATYRIPTDDLDKSVVLDLFSYIIHNILDMDFNPVRTVSYELAYPLWVKEHIHIENPYLEWDAAQKDYKEEHPSLLYTQAIRINGHVADFDIELKHLQDHVPVDALDSYWKITKAIKKFDLPQMTVSTGN